MNPDSSNTVENPKYEQHQRIVESVDSSGFQQQIAARFLPLYNVLYEPKNDLLIKTRRKLAQARVDTTPELYIARSLGYGVITGLAAWTFTTLATVILFTVTGFELGTLLGVTISNPVLLSLVLILRVPALIIITGLLFGATGFYVAFRAPHILLGLKANERRREINKLLPDTVSYMYALSVGGMNQLEIISAVAESESVYGEVSKEFQTIIQETEYFDADYRTAIQNRAEETPSDNLSGFLTDMLSILSSGGDLTNFLDTKTDKHLRHAKEDQEDIIEMLELFGEMYLNLSLLPLLLIIVITIMQLLGNASEIMLMAVVYVLIPLIGVAFLILMSTVLPDEPGDGTLLLREGESTTSNSVIDVSTAKEFKDNSPVFEKIYSTEVNNTIQTIIESPHQLFIEKPYTTLLITVPVSLLLIIAGAITGIAPRTIDGLFDGLWGTVYYLYIPLYLTLSPITVFAHLQQKQLNEVREHYTEALRKLSSANDTGQTLLESFLIVAETSTGRLSEEFRAINAKVDYNYSLRQAIVEFNNKYKSPELARINNLIIDAQETSSQIGEVLITAAQTSENQDKLKRQRKSSTQMQIVMIIMTFFVLTAVIAAVQDQFIGVIGEVAREIAEDNGAAADGGGAMDFSSIDPTRTGILFFHAVTVQAITAGLLCSYLSTNSLKRSGLFILPMVTICLLIWIFIM